MGNAVNKEPGDAVFRQGTVRSRIALQEVLSMFSNIGILFRLDEDPRANLSLS